MIFFLIFIVQVLVAGIVIFILKRLLDKELIEAALEKLQGLHAPENVGDIIVRLGRSDFQAQGRFEELTRRRFPRAKLSVEEDAALKGGVIITIGDQTLDFSVASRLKGFWS